MTLAAHCRVLIGAIALGTLVSAAGAQDHVLNPQTLTSPSGEWSMLVRPDTMNGDAGAHYTLKRRGEMAWEKDLPFAVWAGAITDSGLLAGFAYEHGLDGRAWGKPDSQHSYLYVVILDQKGE